MFCIIVGWASAHLQFEPSWRWAEAHPTQGASTQLAHNALEAVDELV